ncbi:Zinc finger BED domain-containing protein [Drosera capensis]
MHTRPSDSQPDSVEHNGPTTPSSKPKKDRKKSIVWEYFIIRAVDQGNSRAFCKHCDKSFAYLTDSKSSGTSHLKRHILQGSCPIALLNQEKNLVELSTPASQNATSSHPLKKRKIERSGSDFFQFDQARILHEIARMIILHEHPLHMVEDLGFTEFARTLQPHFSDVSFESVQSECMNIHSQEQQRLVAVLGGVPGRVSLTVDLWLSVQTTGYAVLSGHFVDSDWRLHRRILSVLLVQFPESEVALNQAVLSCLSKWDLDGKLFFVTLEDSFASDAVIRNLTGLLSTKDSLAYKSRFVIGRCYASTLSSLAREALGSVKDTVEKVHRCVKYVKSSTFCEDKFKELKQQLQVPTTASLVFADRTRWDTTYHMLSAASKLKEVFSCLDTSDLGGEDAPTLEEWKKIDILCFYLRLFFEAADILSSKSYPTTNMFFCEACKIRIELIRATVSPDVFIRSLVEPLDVMFEEYWKDCSIILAMAAVMDPRSKFNLVVTNFNRIFGEDNGEAMVKSVEETIYNLFLEYKALAHPILSFDVEQPDESVSTVETHEEVLFHDDGFSDIDVYITAPSDNHTKSELEQYFEEAALSLWTDDFDILQWWRSNKSRFPILSRMAADLLSIPVATVTPGHVFDTRKMKLDSYHCSLKPETLEALICTKEWLQPGVQDLPDVSSASVVTET